MFRKAAAFAAASVLVVANPISTLETFCAHPEGEGDEICTMSTGDQDKNGLSLLQKTVRMTRSDNMVSAETTTTTMLVITKNTTASEAAGVAQNGAGDLSAFLSALVTNLVTVVVCTSIAAYLRLQFPWSYEGNLKTGKVQLESPEQTFFGWAYASMALKQDDVIKAAGLDHWLLLEFTHMSMKILGYLAIPNLLICSPCHVFLGGNRAGDDTLSYLGMANVVDGSNLYWLHCVVVWISVWIVQHHIYAAMHEFMHLRSAWLKEMPDPRSQTILVENIQEENRSDKKLAQYFETMLRGGDASGEAIVESAYVVKDLKLSLIATAQKHAEYCDLLEEAKAKEEPPKIAPEGQSSYTCREEDKVDAITVYKQKLDELEAEAETERKKILGIVESGDLDPTLYTCNGFVTFKHRRECEISMQLKYTPDEDILVVSVPPDPSDVVYTDLMVDETKEAVSETIGWACVAGLFFGYMPIIIGISSVASLSTLSAHIPLFRMIVDSHPGVAAVWDGLVGAIALTLMISFLPTFLVLIFDTFFALKARAWLQHKVQIWYYYFNLVFILLVTAVGSSLLATVDSLLEDPTSVFKLLASTLPTASHFYLNLYPAQWTTQSMEFMRYVPLTKWIAFNKMLGDEEKAHDKAEPEDQDYYGKGSRSARFTIFLVIAVTFCTLSPLMLVLAFIHFALIRLWYGWMFVYAEIPKPDLGGAFWHSKLKHVQQGVFIYIVLMAGVLYYRGTDEKTGEGPGSVPGFIAGASLLYMYKSYNRFDRHFHWEQLPFEDIRDDGGHKKREPRRSTYQQPELEAPLKRKE
jgi:hypothetical protein